MKNIKHLPLVLLCLFSIRFLIKGVNFPEVCLIASLAALSYFFQVIEKSEDIKKIEKKLQEFEEKLTESNKLNEDLKQSMSAMKVAAGFRPQIARNP